MFGGAVGGVTEYSPLSEPRFDGDWLRWPVSKPAVLAACGWVARSAFYGRCIVGMVVLFRSHSVGGGVSLLVDGVPLPTTDERRVW